MAFHFENEHYGVISCFVTLKVFSLFYETGIILKITVLSVYPDYEYEQILFLYVGSLGVAVVVYLNDVSGSMPRSVRQYALGFHYE